MLVGDSTTSWRACRALLSIFFLPGAFLLTTSRRDFCMGLALLWPFAYLNCWRLLGATAYPGWPWDYRGHYAVRSLPLHCLPLLLTFGLLPILPRSAAPALRQHCWHCAAACDAALFEHSKLPLPPPTDYPPHPAFHSISGSFLVYPQTILSVGYFPHATHRTRLPQLPRVPTSAIRAGGTPPDRAFTTLPTTRSCYHHLPTRTPPAPLAFNPAPCRRLLPPPGLPPRRG